MTSAVNPFVLGQSSCGHELNGWVEVRDRPSPASNASPQCPHPALERCWGWAMAAARGSLQCRTEQEGSAGRQGHRGGSAYHTTVNVAKIVKLTARYNSDQDTKITPNPHFLYIKS